MTPEKKQVTEKKQVIHVVFGRAADAYAAWSSDLVPGDTSGEGAEEWMDDVRKFEFDTPNEMEAFVRGMCLVEENAPGQDERGRGNLYCIVDPAHVAGAESEEMER